MKVIPVVVGFVVAVGQVAGLTNAGDFGARALANMAKMPNCALKCVINPKYARTYAPECDDIPFGKEYGRMLCQNEKYQQMLDGCFREKCPIPKHRKKVEHTVS
jgi:hypothetical protein